MNQPYLIVVTGRAGSGKTTFSHALGRQVYMPVVSRDEIKEGYVHTFQKKHSQLPEDTNLVVTNAFFDAVAFYIERGISVIVEAAFQHQLWVSRLEPFMDKACVVLLICSIDDQVAFDRFIQRGLQDERREYFHGDKGVGLARKGEQPAFSAYHAPHLPVPTFLIDTMGEYKPSIKELELLIFAE